MTAAEALDTIAEDAWQTLVAAQPYYAAQAGITIETLPRQDLSWAENTAAAGRRRLAQLATINDAELDRSRRLTKATLVWLAEADTQETTSFTTAFGIAPYQSSWIAMIPDLFFTPFPFNGTASDELYLNLLGDFESFVQAMRERVAFQAAQGWRMPRPALAGARASLQGVAKSSVQKLLPSSSRLEPASPALRSRIPDLISAIERAFQALISDLGDDYEAKAPADVGMFVYPGGEAAYRLAVERNLSLKVSPEAVHQKGLEEVARLADAMAQLRSRGFGFDGEEADFHQRLRGDEHARARSAEALEATYRRHLARMAERVPHLFERGPAAGYDIARLAPEFEASMAYGYYRPPIGSQSKGVYHYSGAGLDTRLQLNAAPIMYHELLPGHHFHIARQAELQHLPSIRRVPFDFQAFNEGWAEYSASLGEDEGLYDDPYDQYGWLAHQRFVAQRLVVDTGLNAFRWPLEQARAFMSKHTLETPEFVASETLRYSTDIPAQALAYRWGFLKMRELRARASERLKAKFNVRRWHEAILSEGGLPLSVLDQGLGEWEDAELAA